jgi:hypothetical protein
MARILLADVLKKTPTLAHNHFLEVVFLLNACVAVWRRARRCDATDGHLGMADCTAVLATKLVGSSPEARARRFTIYKARRPLMLQGRLLLMFRCNATLPQQSPRPMIVVHVSNLQKAVVVNPSDLPRGSRRRC